jgi:hypothetical protein
MSNFQVKEVNNDTILKNSKKVVLKTFLNNAHNPAEKTDVEQGLKSGKRSAFVFGELFRQFSNCD